MHCRSGGSLSTVTVDLRVLCQGTSHSLGSQCVLCLLGGDCKGIPTRWSWSFRMQVQLLPEVREFRVVYGTLRPFSVIVNAPSLGPMDRVVVYLLFFLTKRQ